jgi:hypothetical protein
MLVMINIKNHGTFAEGDFVDREFFLRSHPMFLQIYLNKQGSNSSGYTTLGGYEYSVL